MDESPEHIMFYCPRFTPFRKELAKKLGTLYPEDIVLIMMESIDKWNIWTTTKTKAIKAMIDFRADKENESISIDGVTTN